MASVSDADPVPPWDPEGEGGSIYLVGTAELTAAHENPWSTEDQTSIVVFAGPAAEYLYGPEGGAGIGVEGGIEFRDYFENFDKGGFFSCYLGAGSVWPSEGENLSTISAGLKAGTRIHVSSLVNGEFYFGPGGHIPIGSDLHPFMSIYLGFRTNLML
jgi:hypothetical protein